MKVEENLVVLPQVKRRQAYYLPKQDQKHQLKIDDFLLKKKKRLNENDLLSPCATKRAKMLLNPFNKFNNFYLFDSSDHCSSLNPTKLTQTKLIANKINNLNNQNINNQNNQNSKIASHKIHLDTNHSIGHQKSHHQLNQHKSITNLHTNLLFNRKTNLPLSSSPIPQRKTSFNFERSIKSTNAIQRAILNKEPETDENFNLVVKKTPNKTPLFKNLLGNFEVSFVKIFLVL